jgi:integrase
MASTDRLKDRQIKAATAADKDYKLSDGGGLFLLIKRNGSKYWRMKYRFAGKEKLLSFGTYPDVRLAEAREARQEAKRLLKEGRDPSAVKQAAKRASASAAQNSFERLAREFFEVKMKDKSASHHDRSLRMIETYLLPSLAKRPINDIDPPELLEVLRKIQKTGKLETMKRAKQVAGQIFRYAIASGHCDRDPSADLKDALPTPKKKHHAAITEPAPFGKLLLAIDAYSGTPSVVAALKCSALWFCRPGELRHIEWSQVNRDQAQIEIIAEKTGQQHIIPLSRQSLEVLDWLEPITSRSKYVFPSARGASRPMSENGVRTALRTMGYGNDDMTAHGFRAAARTLLDEVLEYPPHIIDQQLAHIVKDPNGRAYNRTAHLRQRREMMQHWADYLDQLRKVAGSSNVISASFR